MTSPQADAAPLRGRAREAQNNDGAILRAAREVFSEYGWGAPMSEIAARARTGVASIYRRYPSKGELVNAIRVFSLEQICALAEHSAAAAQAAGAAGPAESAVERFLRGHIESASPPLAATFGRYVETTPEIDRLAERLRLALEEVLAVDRAHGTIPAHYGPADVMLTITHLRPTLSASPERSREIHLRELDYVLHGLRAVAASGSPIAGTPSDWDEWLRLNSTNAGRPGEGHAAGE